MRQRIGYATARIFASLARGNAFGLDIVRDTGLPTGTVYPTLTRAEASGLVRGFWEARGAAAREARPRRRYYTLTSAGQAALDQAVERFQELANLSRARSRS